MPEIGAGYKICAQADRFADCDCSEGKVVEMSSRIGKSANTKKPRKSKTYEAFTCMAER